MTTDVDQTMQALLAVHRAEIQDRDDQIRHLQEINDENAWTIRDHNRKIETYDDRLVRKDKMIADRDTGIAEQQERIDKLTNIIDTLKIELATARGEATEARETQQ